MRYLFLVLLLLPRLALADEPASTETEPAITGKERLSDKAADQQRVDNCKVPEEKRGTTPRPDCKGKTASAATD